MDILLKDDITKLEESRSNAEKRLLVMERRFQKEPKIKEQYHNFLEEYLIMGHMSQVPENQLYKVKNYLPHHAVIKESSSTTKLRVVFDASCKTKSGIALNDGVMAGR